MEVFTRRAYVPTRLPGRGYAEADVYEPGCDFGNILPVTSQSPGRTHLPSGPPGTFPDQQSIINFSGVTHQSVVQTFSAKLDNGKTVGLAIAAFGGTVANPVGQLNIEKYAGYVSINGNTGGQVDKNGKLVPGTYTPCNK